MFLKKQTLKWGILGTARIAKNAMIPAIKQSKQGEVAAVASRSVSKAQEFAQSLEIPKAYGTYEELINDPEINAVYVPLPNNLHKEWVIEAAQVGKHVLCEKPLALSADEAREMKTEAETNKVVLMEALMYRYHSRFQKIIDLIREGTIGSLRFIQTAFTYNITNPDDIRLIPNMGGGALLDVGCYCVDFSRQIAGREPISVQALYYEGNTGIDLQMAGTLDFGDNIYAQFNCAFNTAQRQFCHVAGSEGTLDIPNPFNCYNKRTAVYVNTAEDQREVTFGTENEYKEMVDHFARCVFGKEKPHFPLMDSISNMQVIDALFQSAIDNGKLVRLS